MEEDPGFVSPAGSSSTAQGIRGRDSLSRQSVMNNHCTPPATITCSFSIKRDGHGLDGADDLVLVKVSKIKGLYYVSGSMGVRVFDCQSPACTHVLARYIHDRIVKCGEGNLLITNDYMIASETLEAAGDCAVAQIAKHVEYARLIVD